MLNLTLPVIFGISKWYYILRKEFLSIRQYWPAPIGKGGFVDIKIDVELFEQTR